jgi:hypothetical protein
MIGEMMQVALGAHHRQQVFISDEEFWALARDSHAFSLLAWLRAKHGPQGKFPLTNNIRGGRKPWAARRVALIRAKLIALGIIELVRSSSRGRPPIYGWAKGYDFVPINREEQWENWGRMIDYETRYPHGVISSTPILTNTAAA